MGPSVQASIRMVPNGQADVYFDQSIAVRERPDRQLQWQFIWRGHRCCITFIVFKQFTLFPWFGFRCHD